VPGLPRHPGLEDRVPEVYRVPKLGGQKATYIVAALKAYKIGRARLPDDARHRRDRHGRDMEDSPATTPRRRAPRGGKK
jgi:cytochrome c553